MPSPCTARIATVALFAGVTLVPGSPAQALPLPGEVSLQAGALTFTGGESVANDVTVQAAPGGALDFTDAAAFVNIDPSAATACTRLTNSSVRCSVTGLTVVRATLGAGDDKFDALGLQVRTVVWGDAGKDDIAGGSVADNLSGGAGDDKIHGWGGDDVIAGDDGNDTVVGNEGADKVYGDKGDDFVSGLGGNDSLYGGAGTDTITGGSDDDKLVGSGTLRGGFGNDTIDASYGDAYGDHGNDLIYAPTDNTYGGPGVDTVDYSDWAKGIRVSLNNQSDDRSLPICDDLVGCPVVNTHNVHDDVENVIGSAHGDEITGTDAVNDLRGAGGNDKIWGLGGDDKLDAQGGTSQHLAGGDGVDECFGAGTLHYTSCEVR